MSLTIKIKRFDPDLALPAYQTAGAAGMDLVARLSVTIAPHQTGEVPLNVGFELPEGYWALVAARSSLHKRGLALANGIGIGDSDYAGPEDEYRAVLLNFTDQAVTVERGDRIAQLLVLPYPRIQWQEVRELQKPSRGGLGSTGRS